MTNLACQVDRALGVFDASAGITHHPKVPARLGERPDHRVENSDQTRRLVLPGAKRNADFGMVLCDRQLAHVVPNDACPQARVDLLHFTAGLVGDSQHPLTGLRGRRAFSPTDVHQHDAVERGEERAGILQFLRKLNDAMRDALCSGTSISLQCGQWNE